ncbi:MAG TPA: hypothetical protein VMK84_03455, partial [Streptosporangiaceae bacterium]|nr:hypothetical protein [Streptosporangiaceae bacterium]
SPALAGICNDLLEASIPDQFTNASTSLAAGWTDVETFSRPPSRGTREPRDPEKAAARRLTRTLRDATAGKRDTVTFTSPVPPGRLKMRQVLAAGAQRAAGARPTAEPFTRTRSRRVPAPPLRVSPAVEDVHGARGMRR